MMIEYIFDHGYDLDKHGAGIAKDFPLIGNFRSKQYKYIAYFSKYPQITKHYPMDGLEYIDRELHKINSSLDDNSYYKHHYPITCPMDRYCLEYKCNKIWLPIISNNLRRHLE